MMTLKQKISPCKCDCCLNIWSSEKITIIPLSEDGESSLQICPDCFEAFNKLYVKRSEVTPADLDRAVTMRFTQFYLGDQEKESK